MTGSRHSAGCLFGKADAVRRRGNVMHAVKCLIKRLDDLVRSRDDEDVFRAVRHGGDAVPAAVRVDENAVLSKRVRS